MKLFNKIEDCIGCKQCERPVRRVHHHHDREAHCGKTEPEGEGVGQHAHQAADHPVRHRHDAVLLLRPLCTYPCPTECLVMTPEFEFAEFDKDRFLYRFAKDAPKFTTLPPVAAGEKKH
ncbi:MAG: hypothetical protein U0166_04540 [Acidobacteriota bacterium]